MGDMKLAASLIVRNERGRYLEPCVSHLREFCDLVCVLDDRSTDGTFEWLRGQPGVNAVQTLGPTFFKHEGQARQRLLEFTLEAKPTHVLALDADEFVSDGSALRRIVASSPAPEFGLEMAEVWRAFDECLCVRMDGGWRPHRIPAVWRVPDGVSRLRIADRALACGRVPVSIDERAGYAQTTGTQLLHFGWANEAERVARHERYAVADGGRFHRSAHLDSILWSDSQVGMRGHPWPAALEPWRAQILDYASGVVA